MSEEDRKLLELAANAAGLEINWFKWERLTNQWNPLINDGDALRLAVRLGLEIYIDDGTHTIVSQDLRHDWNGGIIVEHGADMYSATRLAIVRAAAEIGKAMP